MAGDWPGWASTCGSMSEAKMSPGSLRTIVRTGLPHDHLHHVPQPVVAAGEGLHRQHRTRQLDTKPAALGLRWRGHRESPPVV